MLYVYMYIYVYICATLEGACVSVEGRGEVGLTFEMASGAGGRRWVLLQRAGPAGEAGLGDGGAGQGAHHRQGQGRRTTRTQ